MNLSTHLPILVALLLASTYAQELRLSLDGNGGSEAALEYTVPNGQSAALQQSHDLSAWAPIHAATVAGQHTVRLAEGKNEGYFRTRIAPEASVIPTSNWKGAADGFAESFLSPPAPLTADGVDLQYLKFHVLLDDLTKVYFQNSAVYPFHYTFATAELGPLKGQTLLEYDASVNRGGPESQIGIAGTVILAKDRAEFGLQLIGNTPYSPEWTAFLYKLVAAHLGLPEETRGFYMPLPSQRKVTEDAKDYFESQGIALGEPRRWQGTADGCYSAGWAIGRLRYVLGNEIDQAFEAGELRFDDILVTDTLPREVPDLQGIVSFSASTPNSHVALLSQSRQTPFAFVQDASTQQFLSDRLDQEVLYRIVDCRVVFKEIDHLTTAEIEQLVAHKAPPQLAITPIARNASLWTSADELEPADIAHFGGKAANFGVLRDEIPDNAPIAGAFSFNLWMDFMDQSLENGATLGNEITSRLQGFSYPPANVAALTEALEGVRELIKETPIPASLKPEILSSLSAFDDHRKLRFRSSTNVEDSANFSGAGLYDSFSGCLADDTDADDAGPSGCDDTKAKERGVFRAIRKVFASFYNSNAYLARLKHGVTESDAGMAILVHHSYPDPIEVANGVITYPTEEINRLVTFGPSTELLHQLKGSIVSQPGAASVTNPDGTSLPEVMSISNYLSKPFWIQGDQLSFVREKRATSLPQDTDAVLAASEYEELFQLIDRVFQSWKERFPDRTGFVLDFEYKKVRRGEVTQLEIKQVREVPQPAALEPILFPGDSVDRCPWSGHVHHGNDAGVYGLHRLKGDWNIAAEHLVDLNGEVVASENIQTTWHRVRDGEIVLDMQALSQKPGYQLQIDHWRNTDRLLLSQQWQDTVDGTPAQLNLQMVFPEATTLRQSPVVFADEVEYFLSATYPEIPQPNDPWGDEEETVPLLSCPEALSPGGSISQDIEDTGVTIAASIQFVGQEDEPAGELETQSVRSVATTVSGLTSSPFTLSDRWSQSIYPRRHNWTHFMVLEPTLAPNLSAEVLQELRDADVHQILAEVGQDGSIRIVGQDGVIRRLDE